MRWEVITKAWDLAKQSFPDVDRVFVLPPANFGDNGSCPVFDMDRPKEPIGFMSYRVVGLGERPVMQLSLGDKTAEIVIPRTKSANFEVSFTKAAAPTGEVDPAEAMARYAGTPLDEKAMEQMSKFMVAKEQRQQKARIYASEVVQALKEGIAEKEKMAAVCGLTKESIGPISKLNEFKNFTRVRITQDDLPDYNECGKIIGKKRAQKATWYLVLVDGSDDPRWFHQDAIAEVKAGKVSDE